MTLEGFSPRGDLWRVWHSYFRAQVSILHCSI